jgi:hypothetical protein
MSHLRVLICRVEDENDQMTELTSVDLPAVLARRSAAPLDTLEAQVATVGQQLLGHLCALQWEEVDAQAAAEYCAGQEQGSVWADGYEKLSVASRFGTLHLRRQVIGHRDGRPHVMPGNDLLPPHHGLLITRGLQEMACLLPQEVPFATAARLLGWQTGEPDVLSATTVRMLVRDHGGRIRRLEQTEAVVLLYHKRRGRPLRGVPRERPRRRPSWPEHLTAAVEAALTQNQKCPPEGVSWGDWERVRTARTADAVALADLRRLGPEVAPGQMLLVLDEVLTHAPGQGHSQELRTACLLTAHTRRYLSGRGSAFLRQVQAAVFTCFDQSLLVVADGASWIRTFYRDYLAALPQTELLLDWHHRARQEVA